MRERQSQKAVIRGLAINLLRFGPTPSGREIVMRLILGIILGALLTVGGAYVADTRVPADQKPMVNWDVVSKNTNDFTAWVKVQWNKLTG
jgi:hypothetical protein